MLEFPLLSLWFACINRLANIWSLSFRTSCNVILEVDSAMFTVCIGIKQTMLAFCSQHYAFNLYSIKNGCSFFPISCKILHISDFRFIFSNSISSYLVWSTQMLVSLFVDGVWWLSNRRNQRIRWHGLYPIHRNWKNGIK